MHILPVMTSDVAAQVAIYTTPICGYCMVAKRLLKKKGVDFDEIEVGDRGDLRNWLMDETGQQTVPQLFINGESIGGYSDLADLEKAGELDTLLACAPQDSDPELQR
jgi:glutaredoxin 3